MRSQFSGCTPTWLLTLGLLVLMLQTRPAGAMQSQEEREADLLSRMWSYTPELPRHILSQAVGMQGDRSRLEHFMAKLLAGQPVKIGLLGGSLSLRGWNYPDESYMRQVHKWLELTFVDGCRAEAEARVQRESQMPSPPQWKGKRKDYPKLRRDLLAPSRAMPGIDSDQQLLERSKDEDMRQTWEEGQTWHKGQDGDQEVWDQVLPTKGVDNRRQDKSSQTLSREDAAGAATQTAPAAGDAGTAAEIFVLNADQLSDAARGLTATTPSGLSSSNTDKGGVRNRLSTQPHAMPFQHAAGLHPHTISRRRSRSVAATVPTTPPSLIDMTATEPSEGEWIPERGPATPTELQSVPSQEYRSTGHMCGASRIEFVNLAVAAAGPAYAERCVLQRFPEDADLVILDFGINDFQKADTLIHPERQALERILRRALSLPKTPAVILFEAYSPYQAKNSFVGVGQHKRENLSQDKHVLIGEYYGNVQVLSVRAALWQLIVASEDAKDPNLLIFLGRHFLNDLIHVTPFGHRWYADLLITYLRDVATDIITRRITARVLADKLPAAARAAWQLMASSAGQERRLLEGNGAAKKPAAFQTAEQDAADANTLGSGENAVADTSQQLQLQHQRQQPLQQVQRHLQAAGLGSAPCWSGDRNGSAAAGGDGGGGCQVAGGMHRNYAVRSSPSGLKLPLFRDNEYEQAGVCAVGHEFEALVTDSTGWQWQDDGKPGRPKWGFVADKVGQRLIISVNISGHQVAPAVPGANANTERTGNQEHEARFRDRFVNGFLIYLSSWKDMGSAAVRCSGGCTCDESIVDGMSKETRFRASVPAVHEFRMLPAAESRAAGGGQQSQADQGLCLVSIEILAKTTSEGHKFKVMGLTTSTHRMFHLDYIVREGEDHTATLL